MYLPYCTVLYLTAGKVLYNEIQYSTLQYDIVQHSTIQYIKVNYSTVCTCVTNVTM